MKKIILTTAAASFAIMFAATGTASAQQTRATTIKPAQTTNALMKIAPDAWWRNKRPAQFGPSLDHGLLCRIRPQCKISGCGDAGEMPQLVRSSNQKPAFPPLEIISSPAAFLFLRGGSAPAEESRVSDHLQRLARARRREYPVKFGELLFAEIDAGAGAVFCDPFRASMTWEWKSHRHG
jgi:hypothetical protein